MSAQIEFLGPLKQLVQSADQIEVTTDNVGDVLLDLNRTYPNLTKRLITDEGTLHAHINIYINEVDIRLGDALLTKVSHGDQLTVISAIAGG